MPDTYFNAASTSNANNYLAKAIRGHSIRPNRPIQIHSKEGNILVNRTRCRTCVNRVVLVLWKERAMYGDASWALSPERASANMKMGKNLGQNTRVHRYITVPDTPS
jgi:histidine ammonia-lyase